MIKGKRILIAFFLIFIIQSAISAPADKKVVKGWLVQPLKTACVINTYTSGKLNDPEWHIKMGYLDKLPSHFMFSASNSEFKHLDIPKKTKAWFVINNKNFEAFSISKEDDELVLTIPNDSNLQKSLLLSKSLGIKIYNLKRNKIASFNLENISGAIKWLDSCKIKLPSFAPKEPISSIYECKKNNYYKRMAILFRGKYINTGKVVFTKSGEEKKSILKIIRVELKNKKSNPIMYETQNNNYKVLISKNNFTKVENSIIVLIFYKEKSIGGIVCEKIMALENKSSAKEAARLFANILAKNLPQRIDDLTVISTVMNIENKIFIVKKLMPTEQKNSIEKYKVILPIIKKDIEGYKKEKQKEHVNTACSDKNTIFFLKKGVSINIKYIDNENISLFDYDISNINCI